VAETYEGEVWDEPTSVAKWDSAEGGSSLPLQQMMIAPGAGMVQAHTPYVSAMQVLKPRDMVAVEKSILRQAALMGEDAFYGWGAGKGRVEGASIKLAMVMFNAFGNITMVAPPVQETPEAFIFTHYIVDLESGASAPRQWRESKRSVVDGRMDEERKMQIRFNRGQSKNQRNVILNRMPQWLIDKALEEAKKGSRDKLQKFVDAKGIAAAQTLIVGNLAKVGVTEAQILEKMGVAEIKGLDVDDLTRLNADYKAIDSGEEHASTLFPSTKEPSGKIDLKDKLKSQVEKTAAKPDPDAKKVEEMQVRLGKQPFTWIASDGMKEHTVTLNGDETVCTCQAKGCLHGVAVEVFRAQNA
jgi:hypothetical protein